MVEQQLSEGSVMNRSKYRNKRTYMDGYCFDSMAEASRYRELKLLERAGEVSELQVHPHYPIEVNGKHICTYEADFAYVDTRGTVQVEDVKGARTALYILKKKLVKAALNIEIQEVKPKRRERPWATFDQLDGVSK